MSLLVTSCTMGKQPDRLLVKGPQYLRTRTNMGLFAHHRKSAVELLAASKSQFYHGKDPVGLDKQQDLAITPGQSKRYGEAPIQKEPSRSKSQYDLSQILSHVLAEENSDVNNNSSSSSHDTSDDSIQAAKLEVVERTRRLSLNDHNTQLENSGSGNRHSRVKASSSSEHNTGAGCLGSRDDDICAENVDTQVSIESGLKNKSRQLRSHVRKFSHNNGERGVSVNSTSKDFDISSPKSTLDIRKNSIDNPGVTTNSISKDHTGVSKNSETSCPCDISGETSKLKTSKTFPVAIKPKHSENTKKQEKPAVPPRKPRLKPVPPPRKPKSLLLQSHAGPCSFNQQADTVQGGIQRALETSVSGHDTEPLSGVSRSTPTYSSGSLTPKDRPWTPSSTLRGYPSTTPEEEEESKLKATTPRKKSLVESLTQHFTNLSAPSTPCALDSIKTQPPEIAVKPGNGDNVITYTATPIFISKPTTRAQTSAAKAIVISGQYRPDDSSASPSGQSSTQTDLKSVNSRKRCPNVPTSNKYSKRERRGSQSDNSLSSPVINSPAAVSSNILQPALRKVCQFSPSQPEMSIASVDQAVCTSEVNAAASSSSPDMEEMLEDEEAREVSRTSSSLSGKLEASETPAMNSGACFQGSTVPRSHSDISCRLEGQHSRDSSVVSNHSQLSRASVGADLEKFFNQMGLEKSVLEPITRLSKLQACEIFDSVSSLDSQDAASICSTYSRSEQEWSDSQSVERTQHPTSVVERNARIIKWLCNVRKAKVASTAAKTESGATGAV